MQDNELPLYVADSHSLIWYLLDSPRLSFNANEVFNSVEQGKAKLLIPAIVIAEIIFIVQGGKVQADLNSLILKIQDSDNFQISPLGLDELICLKEQTEISEMHDRFIVCEAILHKAKIITKDKQISNSGVREETVVRGQWSVVREGQWSGKDSGQGSEDGGQRSEARSFCFDADVCRKCDAGGVSGGYACFCGLRPGKLEHDSLCEG